MKFRAKKPNTTVGTPAMISRIGLKGRTEFRRRVFAQIDGNTQPTGKANAMPIRLVRMVAFSRGKMPNLKIAGCQLVPVTNSASVGSGR